MLYFYGLMCGCGCGCGQTLAPMCGCGCGCGYWQFGQDMCGCGCGWQKWKVNNTDRDQHGYVQKALLQYYQLNIDYQRKWLSRKSAMHSIQRSQSSKSNVSKESEDLLRQTVWWCGGWVRTSENNNNAVAAAINRVLMAVQMNTHSCCYCPQLCHCIITLNNSQQVRPNQPLQPSQTSKAVVTRFCLLSADVSSVSERVLS